MADASDKWNIEKLDGDNWLAWKFQMMNLLEAKDLWEHAEGTAQPPADNDQSRAAHLKAQKKAKATIALGVRSSLVYLINSCTTPKQMWDTLKAQFERNTLANKLLLKRDYFTRKMQEGQQTVQDEGDYGSIGSLGFGSGRG